MLEKILEKGSNCEHITNEEAQLLDQKLTPDYVHILGKAAFANRKKRFGLTTTYVNNLQINPSNICVNNCKFCTFSAKKEEKTAYLLQESDIFKEIAFWQPDEVHIVGGLNHEWNFKRNLKLIKDIRSQYPEIHIKGFTAVEIDWFAEEEATKPLEILEQFKEAGINALPGGGAEIFSKQIREQYCPDKLSPQGWLKIHKTAHRLEIKSNATMLYGLGENTRDWIEHLLALRKAEEESPGFSCFIPLAFQKQRESGLLETPPPLVSLAVTALARLLLDNFKHIKAYWVMLGLELAATALGWGADDLDGTLGRERIAHAAGAKSPKGLATEELIDTITLAGFKAQRRDGKFAPLEPDS